MKKKIVITSLLILSLFLAKPLVVRGIISSPNQEEVRNQERTENSAGVKSLTPTPQRLREEVRIEERIGTSPAVLQEKIKEIREAVRERVQERIQEIKRNNPRAYVGKIKQINEESLILETRRGEIQVLVSEETKIVGQRKEDLKLTNLKVGDFCIAMGYLTEEETLEAKRIVIIPQPKLPSRIVAFGRVIDISQEEKVLTVKNERRGFTYTVLVTDNTIITKKIAGRVQKVNFSAVAIGDNLVVVGIPKEEEKQVLTAKIIHIIPGLARKSTPYPSPSPSLPE